MHDRPLLQTVNFKQFTLVVNITYKMKNFTLLVLLLVLFVTKWFLFGKRIVNFSDIFTLSDGHSS